MECLNALGEALAEAPQEDSNDSCAICLSVLDPCAVDIALVKGCLHPYCVGCVTAWAASRAAKYPDAPTPCPVCKAGFLSVYVQRSLSGEVTDHLVEESMVLLMRARWTCGAAGQQDDCFDDEADCFDDEEDEEELLARQHRVRLIGNRRFGGGGFVANGRLLARPLPPPPAPRPTAKKAAEASPAPKHPQRAKREAKAAQAAAKEAERRARRLGRLLPTAAAGAACEDEAAEEAC